MEENNVKPESYMLWAILSTLFCCLPLGIVAIINAAKVDSLYSQGEHEAAEEASEKAKKYSKYGAICGVVIMVLYVIMFAMGAVAGM